MTARDRKKLASSSTRRWTRRDLLNAGLLGGSSWVLPSLSCSAGSDVPYPLLLEQTLRELRLSTRLGDAFLSSQAATNLRTFARLSEQIREHVLSDGNLPSNSRELSELFSQAIRSDFQEAQLCVLQDWYLSRTECWLAAAKSLLVPGQERLLAEYEWAFHQDILDWGPRRTEVGRPFNRLDSGESAFWLRTGPAAEGLVVFLGERELPTKVWEDIMAVALPEQLTQVLLASPGSHPLHLIDPQKTIKQFFGVFEVDPTVAQYRQENFGEVTAWGPQSTTLGRPPEVQPGHPPVFYVTIENAPGDTRIYLDEVPLTTTYSLQRVTAALDLSRLETILGQAGSYPLYLVSRLRQTKHLVGNFVVQPATATR